jgi:hypothetical protein
VDGLETHIADDYLLEALRGTMKFALVIPDGVGIRNFLCTRFVELLLEHGQCLIWHALPEQAIQPLQERWGPAVQWAALPRFREGPTERVLRQAKIYAQLYWQYERDAADVLLAARRPGGRWRDRLLTGLAQSLGRLHANPRGVVWLDQLHAQSTLRARYLDQFEQLLRRERPDIVFCTHQRASRAVPALLAARKHGIPTAAFIYSWDNLPKGRMAVHADHFLVWSSFMRQELLHYHPEVVPDRVHIVGTPQFEHYYNPALVQPRELFLCTLGLDPLRPVVCFSGDDVATSPCDPVYLADLAEALRALPAARRPQILFRRCPVDTSDRYQWVLERYPEIRVSDPRWMVAGQGDWTQSIPTMEDIALLVNVVQHSDAVVNLGSTMAMDFAILGKPGVYVAYDPPGLGGRLSVRDIYRLPHLRCVHTLDPVYWARSAHDIGQQVDHALRHPQEKEAARQAWLMLQVEQPMDRASERCRDALLRIAAVAEPLCI